MTDLLTLRANAHSWDRSASTPSTQSLLVAFALGLCFSLAGVCLTLLRLGKITEANTLRGRLRFGWTALAAGLVGTAARVAISVMLVVPYVAANASRF